MPTVIQIDMECRTLLTPAGAHAIAYALLRRRDERQASELHEAQRAAAHPRWTQRHGLLSLRFACPDDKAASQMLWALLQDDRVLVGEEECRAQSVQTVERLSLEEPATPVRELELEFLTPTSFKQGGHDLPLPIPALIIASAERACKLERGARIADAEDGRNVGVHLARHKISCEEANLSNGRSIRMRGFEGLVRLEASDAAGAERLGDLARMVRVCNIGSKAGYGCGWAQVS